MNNNQNPLISVIIPTRERADTLFFAIKTALDQKSNNYEVVISDNFSQDNTKKVVEGFNDPRLVYLNSGRRLSMCDNYEFALEHAKGEYIIIIGDDDAVMPGAIDKLEVTINSRPSLVYSWSKPNYTWPKDGKAALVSDVLPRIHPSEIDLKKTALRFVGRLRGGEWLTSPYHGAVARSILNAIRNQTGRVFHSTQHDIFTAFAVPVFSDTAVNVGYPVTVQGRSPKANSAVAYGKDSRVNTERMIQEYKDYKIHPTLFPEIDLLANVIQDAVLVAMDKFPQFYGKTHFNYNAMWAFVIQQSGYFQWNISIQEIIQKRQQIRKHHPFSIPQFLKFVIINKLVALYLYRNPVALYRSLLRKLKIGPFFQNVPDDISTFVKQLDGYHKSIVARKKYVNPYYLARTMLALKKKFLHPQAVKQEKKEIAFYSQFIKSGDLCFDVGANVGNKTGVFLKLGARVVAIEPQKLACKKINRLHGDNENLIVINRGLAAEPGFLELSIGEDASVLSTMSETWKKEGIFSQQYQSVKIEKVPVTTLDDLIARYGLPKFCKIDVEGFEGQVLQGLHQPIPYISFEFHGKFLEEAKKCINHLATLGNANFNCCFGTSAEFVFGAWVSANEVLVKIGQSSDKDLWGDIYVTFSG